jgi:hypothetical protein
MIWGWYFRPAIVPDTQHRRVRHVSSADDLVPRPEFDFGEVPSSTELAYRADGKAVKAVSAFYYLVILAVISPFLLILALFAIACIMAVWEGIIP